MFKFYFRCADFSGLTVTVDAKDRDLAFNAMSAHVKHPQSWYLYHQREIPTRVCVVPR